MKTLVRELTWTGVMSAVSVLLATALDYLVNRVLFGGNVNSAATAAIATFVSLPIGFYLARQRTQVQQARARAEAAAASLVEQREAAIAANQAKSAFVALISHELRTPMNGVLGMAHAMTLTGLDDRQSSYMQMLLRSGEGLMSILNDILDLSKIEAGRLDVETIPFDLHELGQRVHSLWTEAASAKGVALVYALDTQVPQWVAGDPTRLRQVMNNLVSNALKFTSQGEVRISLELAAPERCVLRVSDTGAGISPEQQAKLFQPFVQADASTTRKFGGTGLGLAICKQLVTAMGGDIQLASREGEGSTFTVELPLPCAQPVEPEGVQELRASLDGLRLLVADDNSINQAVARAILEAAGAFVTVASDGQEAVARLDAESFDVVLMDVHMPRMSGLEALEEIRAGRAGRADIPVIALTADAMVGVDANLRAAGFDDVEPKPIVPSDLIGKIGLVHMAAVTRPSPDECEMAADCA